MTRAQGWFLCGAMLVGCADDAMPTDMTGNDAGGVLPDTSPAGEGGLDEDASMAPSFDPRSFAVRVVAFEPGSGAGFGQDRMPDVVFGPPLGRGEFQGSLDVVSLGNEGWIVLELGRPIVDGAGTDFLVFENAFLSGTMIFAEPGIVGVSEDGESFVDFGCDTEDGPAYPGCAGVEPVFANARSNDLDPTDPEVAGGDAFDLADVGMARARFVRIRDAGISPGLGGESAGFDLDAIAVVNGE